MAEPKDKIKLNVFLTPAQKKEFKKLCAELSVSMSGRLETWVNLETLYFQEYGKVLDPQDIQKMYFGKSDR